MSERIPKVLPWHTRVKWWLLYRRSDVRRFFALPFLRELRDEGFLGDYQCELLGLPAAPNTEDE